MTDPEDTNPSMRLGESEREFEAYVDQSLDPTFVEAEPLANHYRSNITCDARPQAALANAHAALLCIDFQYLDAARGYGMFAPNSSKAASPEVEQYYFERLERVVVPNVRALQFEFRRRGLELIHTRVRSMTRDGRDRSPGHKRLGLHAPPGSKEAEFLEHVAPEDDEIVIDKTASGIFAATNARYLLSNLGITALYVTGVYTNECVATTIRDACDLGFDVTLVEDGCATVNPTLHRETITSLRDRFARVRTTMGVMAELSAHAPARRD